MPGKKQMAPAERPGHATKLVARRMERFSKIGKHQIRDPLKPLQGSEYLMVCCKGMTCSWISSICQRYYVQLD